jgi:ribosomal protein L14
MLIPIHIVVVMDEDPRQKQWDGDFATAVVIQNFQLLAWKDGLGVVWKTNNYSCHPSFR